MPAVPNGLRILALVTDAYGSRGGIAQYNRDLFAALAGSKAVGRIVVLPRLGEVPGQDVPPKVELVDAMPNRIRYSLRAMRAAIHGGPFDLVFCGHLNLVPLARLISGYLKKPLWLQMHGIDAWDRPSASIRRGVEAARLVTAVSRYTRRRILQWAAMDPQKIRILPNTIRPEFLADDGRAPLRASHPLAGKEFIVTVARISRGDLYKGHAKVIDALPALRQRRPRLDYAIVGDGDARPHLERLAAEAGVAEAVHFLGHVADDEVRALLRAARAFVMPSTKEGFGIAFLEAVACGVPVVAGNVDGSIDALADGVLGTLVDPEDRGALVDAVCAAMDSRRIDGRTEMARFQPANFSRHLEGLLGCLQ